MSESANARWLVVEVVHQMTKIPLGLLNFSFWKWKQWACLFLELFNYKVLAFLKAQKTILWYFPEMTRFQKMSPKTVLKKCCQTCFLCYLFPCCFKNRKHFPFPFPKKPSISTKWHIEPLRVIYVGWLSDQMDRH